MKPFTVLALFFFSAGAIAIEPNEVGTVLAPGYRALQFTLPAAGSYRLPALGSAADGKVLDEQGRSVRLHQLMGDKLVLLSFIYSTCSDVNGCPLATAVFHEIKNRLRREPDVSARLRLLTLSFDPEHDTPEHMRRYGEAFQKDGLEWRFLTTPSETELAPILRNYRQHVQKHYDADGHFTGTFSHILRVYLIDREKRIRNIYSVSFLHADTVLNDVKSLLGPAGEESVQAIIPEAAAQYRAGDDKSRYERADYRTASLALSARTGRQADLLATLHRPPLGLPPVPVPADNPVTPEKVQLGRKLFFDRRLSLNNTFSCAMCHIPEQGFTSNEMQTAVGIEGRTVNRNSPTLYNVGYYRRLFHDGREYSLENQVWGPLLAHNEMANPSIGSVLEKIRGDADYPERFQRAFGKEATMETIGMALASYERTLNSANSAFDRWYFGKEKQALPASAQRGFTLFTGKARCSACHEIGQNQALFTDQQSHNTGIGYAAAMGKNGGTQPLQVAPGLVLTVDSALIASVSESGRNDLGRYEVTQDPADRWRYRTPSLRNVALTAPYMHDGSLSTLKQVVEFYNQGGVANETLDPLMKPLHLSEDEAADLLEFLLSLTGDNIETLVGDAFAAPIGDVR